jgi:hypothetical protein
MTKVQLRGRTLGLMGESDYGTYSEAEIDAALDDAQDEVVADFMVPATHLFRTSRSVVTEVGTYLYDKPEGMIDNPIGMIVTDAENRVVPLLTDNVPLDFAKTAERAFCWYLDGESVVFWPTPSSVRTYSMRGRFYPGVLSAEIVGDDYPESELPKQLQTIQCYTAALELAMGKGDANKNFKNLAAMLQKKQNNYRSTLLTAAKPSKSKPIGLYTVTRNGLR